MGKTLWSLCLIRLAASATSIALCSSCLAAQSKHKTATHSPAPQSKASLPETLDFIKGKLVGARFTWVEHVKTNEIASEVSVTASFQDVSLDGSVLTIKGATLFQSEKDAKSGDYTMENKTYLLDLKQLSLGSSKVISYIDPTPAIAGLKLFFNSPQQVLTKNVMRVDKEDYAHPNTSISNNNLEIMLENQEIAARILQAIESGAQLCGAKKDTF